MSPLTTGESMFVDREDETKHIREMLERAKRGEGKLLLIRGEAGSGKTRLLQESVAEAEKQGFSVGFGSALAESVGPYQAWREALKGLALDRILEEEPPPKLIGLYLLGSDGIIQVKTERRDCDLDTLPILASVIPDSIRKSSSRDSQAKKEPALISRDVHRILLKRCSDFHLVAIVEGREDEFLLADMIELADKAESAFNVEGHSRDEEESRKSIESQMRHVLSSERYEGIDYAKENPKLRQNRLFEQVTLGISRRASTIPLCIVIDDLQWGDPSSLALLHYAVRNTKDKGVLFLGSYRIEDVAIRPHLRDVLKRMEEEGLTSELNLLGLSREHLANLVESFIGSHALSDSFLNHLWEETRGFPLFVGEVLHGLEDDGRIVKRGKSMRLTCELDEIALPKRVRDVIQTRLDRLPKEDRQLLDAAATCGTRFTAALVSKIAGEEEKKVLNGLSSIAMVHGLVRPLDSGFTFNHPVVQEVLYDGVPKETRQKYHTEAAKWLELAGGSREDIAQHYFLARHPHAVERMQEVAVSMLDRYANEEGIRYYIQALELEDNPESRFEILEALGLAYERIGEYEKAIESYENAKELTSENRAIARMLARMGKDYQQIGDYEQSKVLLKEALGLVEGQICSEKALAQIHMGDFHEFKRDSRKALVYYKKGMKMAERVGDSYDVALSSDRIGTIHRRRGDFDQALSYYSKSLTTANQARDHVGLGRALNSIGIVYDQRGEIDLAIENYEKSLAIKERMGDRWAIAGTLHNLGIALQSRGKTDEALECWFRAARISEKIGHLEFLTNHLHCIGIEQIYRGEWDSALENLMRALEQKRRMGTNPSFILQNIGILYAEQDRFDLALKYLKEALVLGENSGKPREKSAALKAMAYARLRMEDLEAAQKLANEALTISKELSYPRTIAASERILGSVYGRRGELNEAVKSLQESISTAESSEMKLEEGRSHHELGSVLLQMGKTLEGKQHLQNAIEILSKIGAELYLQRAIESYESLD